MQREGPGIIKSSNVSLPLTYRARNEDKHQKIGSQCRNIWYDKCLAVASDHRRVRYPKMVGEKGRQLHSDSTN